jgi:hypothetical protein
MRVKVDGLGKEGMLFGEFVGLQLMDGDLYAIVRVDGSGMYLSAYHPSRVTPIE